MLPGETIASGAPGTCVECGTKLMNQGASLRCRFLYRDTVRVRTLFAGIWLLQIGRRCPE
jgi:hypothetical protein